MPIFQPTLDLTEVLAVVRDRGYCFTDDAIQPEVIPMMKREAANLHFELVDQRTPPINRGKPNEVSQFLLRRYLMSGHEDVPIGSELCKLSTEAISAAADEVPKLKGWLANEIGYQRYDKDTHRIGPHSDRKSDHLLSLTITVSGSAVVRIYSYGPKPKDYSGIVQIDQHFVCPGTIMFLRAAGLGSGKRVIHEVMPPEKGSRLVLNLRMRAAGGRKVH